MKIHTAADDGNRTVYQPEEAASPMGCVEQFQYCNAKGRCGNLASFADAVASAALVIDGTEKGVWDGSDPVGATSLRFSGYETIISSSVDLAGVLQSLGAFSLGTITPEPQGGLNGTITGRSVAARCDLLVGDGTLDDASGVYQCGQWPR